MPLFCVFREKRFSLAGDFLIKSSSIVLLEELKNRKGKTMKKTTALILVLSLCLSAMLGLTAIAEAEETATVLEAPEIALANVSVTTNVALLFAVPADGLTVNKDGTVDGLNLLVWEGVSESGKYGRGSADATLAAQGRLIVGENEYVVFVYDGLDAKQMTDTVYARTVVSDGKGNLGYSKVIDYSITEWARSYNSTNAANNALAANLIEYGAAMQEYRSDYKPNGYYANQAKSLVTVTVNSKIAGSDEVVQKQVTQLAVAGSTVTLAAPVIDGYAVSEWSVADTNAELDGVQTVVNSDVEFTATFSPVVLSYESMWSADFDSIATGYVSSSAGAGYNMVNSNSSIRINSGAVAYSDDNNAYVSYVPKTEEGGNKYLCLTSTAGGAIYVNDGAQSSIKTSNYDTKATGGYLTVTFSLMRNEAGSIINSLGLRVRANGTGVNENMRVFNTSADGTVNISIFKNGSVNEVVNTKVGEVAESGWSHFAFVVDLDNLLIHGYMKDASGKWQLKATADVFVPSNYDNIYDWFSAVVKMEWEVSHGEIEQDVWESVVSEEDRDYVENGTDPADRKERMAKIAEKYFSMNIDNYEIFNGFAIK